MIPAHGPVFGKQRLSHHIVQHLRQLIANGELGVGDKLPTEHELCEQFGVSRTTLREAIQALRDQGLVDVAPGRGSRVCAPHPSQLTANMMLSANLLQAPEGELRALRLALLRTVLPYVGQLSLATRQALSHAMVTAQASPAENAATEAAWQMQLLEGTPCATTALLMHVVLAADAPHRLRRCENPAYIGRLQQLHMRLVQAMSVGDVSTTERLMVTWLDVPVMQRAA